MDKKTNICFVYIGVGFQTLFHGDLEDELTNMEEIWDNRGEEGLANREKD